MADVDIGKHVKAYDTSVALRRKLLTLMAIMTLIGTMSSKRFNRALQNGESIPPNLKSALKDTIETCVDLGLELPGTLQAKGLHWAK